MRNPETSSPSRQLFTVQAEEAGQRLDRYLVAALAELSRTSIQQLIAHGAIQVNGRPSKPGYSLRAGDEILVDLERASTTPDQAKPRPLPLDIVYEDEDLLVINKAPGMVVHPAPGHYEDTLVNALLAYYPDLQTTDGDQRPGIVHRLDRDTSGLLIVAKNARTQVALVGQMQRHEVVKRYLALVEGIVALDQGSIEAPIGRDPRHRQQMAITVSHSREARTHFRVLERFARHTLLLVELETGRTHQIRVHLKAIGHPVVGDPTYGSGKALRGFDLRRQFLHASQIQFAHPGTGAQLHFEAPLPADLQNILERKNFL
ncbi:MAG TPA: RluA family pseudouridine synthase [Ktedonobacteraceae bacterium]|nr:RluA family pseudouridine synthase [Ktedonobacteraceae bacterium]